MAGAINRPRRATATAAAAATTPSPSAARPVGAALPAALLLVAVAIAAAAAPARASGLPARVIPLTDASFEHDTQASTGQTTGHWAVLLSDSSASKTLPAARTAAKALAALAAQRANEDADEDGHAPDPGCLYASVDASDEANPALAARFRAFLPGPVLLLFRDRQLFPLPLPRVALSQKSLDRAGAGSSRSDGEAVDAAYHAILDFLTGGFREVDSERIPPPGYGGGGGAGGAAGGGATGGGLVSGLVDGAVNLLAAQRLELDGNHLMVVGVATMALGLVAFVAFTGVAVAVTKGSVSFGNQEPPPPGADPAAVPKPRSAPRKGVKPAPVPEDKEEEEQAAAVEEVMGEGVEAEAEAEVAEEAEAEEEAAEAEDAEEQEAEAEEEQKEEEEQATTTIRRRRPGRA